jgi:hypothetical protein
MPKIPSSSFFVKNKNKGGEGGGGEQRAQTQTQHFVKAMPDSGGSVCTPPFVADNRPKQQAAKQALPEITLQVVWEIAMKYVARHEMAGRYLKLQANLQLCQAQ